MIPQLAHPWLPLKIVLVGLPWVVVLIWPVLDILLVAEKTDAALSNPLLMAHQPAMGLLFLKALRQFHGLDAQVAVKLAVSATFATALVIEPVVHHAAIFLVAECNRVLATKFLSYLQHQGRCLMHLWMTYTHLCAP